jgi:predicted O-methyltransferase YrrM
MSDFVKMSIRVVTVADMGLPRWMTPYAQHIFAIPTHMTPMERLMLTQTALELPEGSTILEIGSYLGASTAFLAAAAVQRSATVHAIDTWMNDAMGAEGTWDTWTEFTANTQPFRDYIVPHRGTSIAVHAAEGNISCGMLFIDGDHTYEGVVTDLKTWLPSLKAGGVLAMHDFDAAAVQQGFAAVVGDALAQPPRVVDRLMICKPQARSAIARNA